MYILIIIFFLFRPTELFLNTIRWEAAIVARVCPHLHLIFWGPQGVHEEVAVAPAQGPLTPC